jgi:exosome complex component RRP42
MTETLDEVLRESVRTLVMSGKRPDGRAFEDFRQITLETDIISTAEGSCLIRLGDTQVLVAVKTLLGQPYSDTPDKGVLITSAELVPAASPEVESGPPMSNQKYIEIARVVDRSIRESKMIDMEKMCVQPEESVRMVFLDIHILDDVGNLIDAATLAAVLALRSGKMPKVKMKDGSPVVLEETEPFPLQSIPIECSVCKFGDKLLVDPTNEEEIAMDSKIVFGMDEREDIRALQKSGSGPWSVEDIEAGLELARLTIRELRKKLELEAIS